MKKIRMALVPVLAVVVMGGGLLSGVSNADAAPADKEFVCHRTASATNPVVQVHISGNAVGDDDSKHLGNHNKHAGVSDTVGGDDCEAGEED